MQLSVSEEQALLRGGARDLLMRRCPPDRLQKLRDEGNFELELWRTVTEMGWPGALAPEPAGMGLGLEDACALLEECGAALAPLPLASSLLAGRLLADAAAPADLLERVAGGELIAVVEGLGAALVRDGGVADSFLSVGENGLRLVPAAQARVEARRTAGRLREATVALDPAGGVEAGTGAGLGVRLRTLRLVLEAAEMAGACARVLEISAEHVKTRVQFDRPLGSFQSVQHRLADMLTDVDGIRWLLRRTAAELDAGRPADGLAVRLSIWTREASRRVVASAHQVHGGVGFIRDHPLHMYFGRQKACELSFGRLEELRELAAADLLGPREGK